MMKTMMRAAMKRCCPADAAGEGCCAPGAPAREASGADPRAEPAGAPHAGARGEEGRARERLEDLIPLAVVITAGCESCAAGTVRRAIEAGSAPRHVLRTIAIVADLSERECFRKNIPPEVIERMKGPLARARRTLDELSASASGEART